MEYPRWFQRAQHVGPVLVQSKKEEEQLLEDWETEQLILAEDAVSKAKAESKDAEDTAKLVLKGKGK